MWQEQEPHGVGLAWSLLELANQSSDLLLCGNRIIGIQSRSFSYALEVLAVAFREVHDVYLLALVFGLSREESEETELQQRRQEAQLSKLRGVLLADLDVAIVKLLSKLQLQELSELDHQFI